ncbi:MAG: AAA family ATPase, partial [Dehalococcoidales bacterium]|nr:AAA family ATPase [Dehalococcoidales bacterium]
MLRSKPPLPPIEISEQFRQALEIMENTPRSIFITGRAGTGKSTLLNYFRLNTRKRVAVLAPTGVAALNVKGQTIHSFFGFKPNITLDMIRRPRKTEARENIYQRLDAIVIDEISMVRADLLDCVDRSLRLNRAEPDKPFGGIQMIFIGDLYQLPPVVTSLEKTGFRSIYPTPYFYSAKVFDGFDMEFLELEKIYRQHDPEFIDLLNSIRNRSITAEDLESLNRRCDPEFESPPGDRYIYLTTTNDLAARINNTRLRSLRSKPYLFIGEIQGEFGNEYLPTAIELQVKASAQIMMLNNDPDGRWVNGTIGEVTGIERDGNGDRTIIAKLPEGEVEVGPYTWEIYRFNVDNGSLQSEVVGTFTQYPLMLAWAITIHKSQGKTFDRVVIDIGSGTFAHGQMYVALSRCTALGGVVLKQRIQKKHIWYDFKVTDFLTKFQYRKSEQRYALEDKVAVIQQAIRDGALLRIVYLKPSYEKTRRTIHPCAIGEMEFQGKTYL